MHIKMIVTDLDGTLLRDDKSISEYTREILSRCRESGIKVVCATGRGGSADKVAPADLFDGRITMNGAAAKAGDASIYKCMIPYQIAQPILIACDRYGLKTTSELNGMHYSNFAVPDEWATVTNYQKVDFANHNIDCETLYAVINSPADILFIEEHLPGELYMYVSRFDLAQIMHKDATKSKALSKLARLWGIDQSEIAAFGDDLNDIDLLEYAGYGVAMGNAVDDVKAAADYICDSNEVDGVAKWLEKHLLQAQELAISSSEPH